jgi:hypothetical protein
MHRLRRPPGLPPLLVGSNSDSSRHWGDHRGNATFDDINTTKLIAVIQVVSRLQMQTGNVGPYAGEECRDSVAHGGCGIL